MLPPALMRARAQMQLQRSKADPMAPALGPTLLSGIATGGKPFISFNISSHPQLSIYHLVAGSTPHKDFAGAFWDATSQICSDSNVRLPPRRARATRR